jgi:hypothetical protein
MALPYLAAVKLEDITVIERLGDRLHGDMFAAKIASFENGKAVVEVYGWFGIPALGKYRKVSNVREGSIVGHSQENRLTAFFQLQTCRPRRDDQTLKHVESSSDLDS